MVACTPVATGTSTASLQLTDFTLKLVHLLLIGRQLIVMSCVAVSLVPMRLTSAIIMPKPAILHCECMEFRLQGRYLLLTCLLRHLSYA